MNFFFIKKILVDEEFRLYELLRLKKNLESRFLNSNFNIGFKELKQKLRYVLITRKLAFLYKSDIQYLIEKIEKILNNNFQDFKNDGEVFLIKSTASIDVNLKPDFFNKFEKYNELLQKYNASLIVQGSYADGTYISYSDIDLVIIGKLSSEIIDIKKAIEQDLLVIDPLQHHGVFFINKNSLSNYWLMDLPIQTLEKAITFSDIPLEMNISKVFIEKYSSYGWVSSFIKTYKYFPITSNSGIFFSKYFFSQLMLVPALLLAIKKIYVYKKDSFELAKKYYSSEAWECIELVSLIRKTWNQQNISSNYLTIRNDINDKNIKEFNVLTDVVNLKEQQFNLLVTSYNLFIIETIELLKNIKNEF
ncbi:MAG: hypothetical protein ACI93N_000051 [Flavobacteriaceae bacterium]|jgi:hypothetical protein